MSLSNYIFFCPLKAPTMLLYALLFSFLYCLFMETFPFFSFISMLSLWALLNWFRTKWMCEYTANTCCIHKDTGKSRPVISKHCFTGTGNVLMLDSKSIKRCLCDDLIMQTKLSTVGGVNVSWFHLTNLVDLVNRINC